MPQIIPIKDLKNTSEISNMCQKSNEPIYITKNGYGAMVIMSIETYENSLARNQIYRDIDTSEAQIASGEAKDAQISISELKKKYEL